MLRRCEGGSTTTRWVVRLITIPVLIVAGCLLAGSVLIVAGLSRPAEYLRHLYGSLWVSFVVGTIAALTVIGYESLRRQLETTSLALRTKQLEEEHARKLALEAQLASLESRVQPHFPFNTLNSIEGQNNLHLDPQPGISAMLSHLHGTWLALYANPTYVHNAHTARSGAAPRPRLSGNRTGPLRRAPPLSDREPPRGGGGARATAVAADARREQRQIRRIAPAAGSVDRRPVLDDGPSRPAPRGR
jgi:hypothetical protein